MTMPWSVAMVAPPRHLPITMEARLTGATSISRRNPNSRSYTIEAAEKMAVNRTESDRTPVNRMIQVVRGEEDRDVLARFQVVDVLPATLADPEVGFARVRRTLRP